MKVSKVMKVSMVIKVSMVMKLFAVSALIEVESPHLCIRVSALRARGKEVIHHCVNKTFLRALQRTTEKERKERKDE